MDTFLKQIERVAELAAAEPNPPPLHPDRVMAQVMARARKAPLPTSATPSPRAVAAPLIPWRFAAGLGAAAASVAAVVGVLALLTLDRAADPYAALALFLDVLS